MVTILIDIIRCMGYLRHTPLFMGVGIKRPLRPVPVSSRFSYSRLIRCGFVGSGMNSLSAQILSRSLRKEFENSCVRGTIFKIKLTTSLDRPKPLCTKAKELVRLAPFNLTLTSLRPHSNLTRSLIPITC